MSEGPVSTKAVLDDDHYNEVLDYDDHLVVTDDNDGDDTPREIPPFWDTAKKMGISPGTIEFATAKVAWNEAIATASEFYSDYGIVDALAAK